MILLSLRHPVRPVRRQDRIIMIGMSLQARQGRRRDMIKRESLLVVTIKVSNSLLVEV
jgi:hypothetical protein